MNYFRWLSLLFELAEWPAPAGAVYTLRAEEVKQTRFRLDGLLLPPPDLPHLPGIFVETQFQLDNDFYRRWFTQIFLFLYRQQWQGAWRAVVIFPSRKVDPQPPLAYQPLLDSPWVKRVYLEDLKDRTDLTPGLQLIQLIVAEPDVAVSQAPALLRVRGGPAADPNWQGWLDLIETILVYKLPRLSREEIQRMLHLPEVELKQTRFYQDVFAEGRTEGRTEGRAEGQQQEAAALVLRLLQRRLGALSADVETQIRTLPVADLEALREALLDWQTPAELLAWLQRQG